MTTDTIAPAPSPLTRLSDDEDLFRASVRAFAEAEIAPQVREMDEQGVIPRALIDKLFDLGVMGIEIPESLGGAGAPFFLSVLAVEELSRVDPSVAVVVDVQNTLVINALLRWGSPDLQRRFLPRLAGGAIGAYALSEAGSGSDAFALRTRAVEDGGDYVITGRKLWITNAREAGLFIVMANVDPAAGHRGITAFLVEHDRPGLEVGKKEDKLGIRASSTCELLLDGCRVPKSHILGALGQGYKVAIETLNEGAASASAPRWSGWPGARSTTPSVTCRSARSSAGRSAGSRPCSSRWRRRRPRSRWPASASTTPRACATPAARS